MGCVAAFLLDSATWREWLKKVSADRWLIPLAFFLLAIEPFVMMHLTGHIHSDVGAGMATIEAFAIASIVLLLVAGKAGIAHAVFNSRVIVHVGTLSYSLYIWQQLLLEPDSSFNFWTLAWRIPGIYVVSLCSFNYLEKPLLRLRKRFRKVPVE
jgi:peptidoglycan/LPS O-acetylase OafA/YrhL